MSDLVCQKTGLINPELKLLQKTSHQILLPITLFQHPLVLTPVAESHQQAQYKATDVRPIRHSGAFGSLGLQAAQAGAELRNDPKTQENKGRNVEGENHRLRLVA
jgi:hypothetical protein